MAELRKKQLRGLNFNTIECYSIETDCLSGSWRNAKDTASRDEERGRKRYRCTSTKARRYMKITLKSEEKKER